MSDAVIEKKRWSKKKKAAVIILSILFTLIVLVVIAGVVALNWYCKTADYTIVSTDKQISLVAHRGFRSVAPENTAPAFEETGKAGFWGAECDIYRSKDGVWVVQHDVNTYRMMDKTASIEKKTYDELMQFNYDNGTNIDDYQNLKICTFEQYLEICAKYGMTAVVEFKGNHNIEHYDEVIELVDKYGVETIFISFQFEDLEALRKLTDADLYYLVQEIKPEDIELAKTLENCGIDFNGNKEENYETDIIQQCKDAGLKLGAWTINDTAVLDKLVDEYGITVITTDAIKY